MSEMQTPHPQPFTEHTTLQRRGRGVWVASKRTLAALGVVALVSGCASLPSSSEPQALRTFEGEEQQQTGPISGRDPDLLLRDFYVANANPTQGYTEARSFLTSEASQQWQPAGEILVVDRFDISSVELQDQQRTYDVRASVVGAITEGGAYRVRDEDFVDRVTLRQVDGQWRIDQLGDRIAIDRSEFRERYASRGVYFFDPSGQVLVQDRRWLSTGLSNLDSALMQLLAQGPSTRLAPGVIWEPPSDAAYAGNSDGIYQFTGLAGMSEDALKRFFAQAVWTLAMADVPGPYRFKFDGANFVSSNGSTEFTADSFPEFNPQAATTAVPDVYSLTNGRLYHVTDAGVTPVLGGFGEFSDYVSARVASDSKAAAAVRFIGEGDNQEQILYAGSPDGEVSEVLRAETISQPTFEVGGTSAWAVVDGDVIVRASRSADTGEITHTAVDITALGQDFGTITEFQLSATGVLAAFILENRVYTAVVSRPNAGERRISNIQELAPVIGATATSIDWQVDGSLIIGTSNPDAPVWLASNDGAAVSTLPSGNVVAPVSAIASSTSTLYLTDARAALELPNGGTTASYWREVQGLEANRSVMIVAR